MADATLAPELRDDLALRPGLHFVPRPEMLPRAAEMWQPPPLRPIVEPPELRQDVDAVEVDEVELVEVDEPFLDAAERAKLGAAGENQEKRAKKKSACAARPRQNAIEGALAGVGTHDPLRSAGASFLHEATSSSLHAGGGALAGVGLAAPLMAAAGWALAPWGTEREVNPAAHDSAAADGLTHGPVGSGGLGPAAMSFAVGASLPPLGPVADAAAAIDRAAEPAVAHLDLAWAPEQQTALPELHLAVAASARDAGSWDGGPSVPAAPATTSGAPLEATMAAPAELGVAASVANRGIPTAEVSRDLAPSSALELLGAPRPAQPADVVSKHAATDPGAQGTTLLPAQPSRVNETASLVQPVDLGLLPELVAIPLPGKGHGPAKDADSAVPAVEKLHLLPAVANGKGLGLLGNPGEEAGLLPPLTVIHPDASGPGHDTGAKPLHPKKDVDGFGFTPPGLTENPRELINLRGGPPRDEETPPLKFIPAILPDKEHGFPGFPAVNGPPLISLKESGPPPHSRGRPDGDGADVAVPLVVPDLMHPGRGSAAPVLSNDLLTGGGPGLFAPGWMKNHRTDEDHETGIRPSSPHLPSHELVSLVPHPGHDWQL